MCVLAGVRVCVTIAIKARQLSGQAINQNMTSAKLNNKSKKKIKRMQHSFSQRANLKSNESSRALAGFCPGHLKSNKTSLIRFVCLWQPVKLDDVVNFYFPSKSPTVCINKQA